MKTKTYTQKELEALTPEQFNEVLMKAVKIEGTAIVRDRHGNIKYDDPNLAGTYGDPI